jgi:hypothetical protein
MHGYKSRNMAMVIWNSFMLLSKVQGDQKVSVHLMVTIQKLHIMFKVSPTSLQIFIDTPNCVLEDRVQYSMVHIPKEFCDGHLQIINCVGIVRIHWVCTLIIRRTETFWSFCVSHCADFKEIRSFPTTLKIISFIKFHNYATDGLVAVAGRGEEDESTDGQQE